jgi:hypothetical protein
VKKLTKSTGYNEPPWYQPSLHGVYIEYIHFRYFMHARVGLGMHEALQICKATKQKTLVSALYGSNHGISPPRLEFSLLSFWVSQL